MPLMPEHIGPYRVLRPIASGGMAEVYEVEDPASGERFALKLLIAVKKALPRFDREYEAMTRLNHPGIVRVYHYGLHEGLPWLTMELLRGVPAQTYLKGMGRAGSPERNLEVLRVGYHIAQSLHYIHDRSLVHRDLKSANVLVLPDGRVKLLDFGAALLADSQRRITAEGEFIGTFSYCSPEQLRGLKVDRRSDIYSLGVLLYRLSTGRRPFETDDPVALAAAHEQGAPLAHDVAPGVPEGLSRLIQVLTSFDPARRPFHADVVAERLEALSGRPFSSRSRLALHNPAATAREVERRAVWARVESGPAGDWIAVEGDEGSDRLRLLERLRQDAEEQGLPHLWFAPRRGRSVAALVEAVAEAWPVDTAELRDLADPVALAVPAKRAQLHKRLAQLLGGLGRALVFVQELHRADTLLLELLGAVLRELQGMDAPVKLVSSVRRTELEQRHSEIGRRFPVSHRVSLQPLSPREVAVAVGTMLGRRPPPAELARRIHQATGGQPLYVEEVVRGMVVGGGIEADGSRLAWGDQAMEIPVPESARHEVEPVLAELPVAGRRVLEALLVTGEGATLPLVGRVLDWAADEVLVVVEDLVERGIVSFDVATVRCRWRSVVWPKWVDASLHICRRSLLQRELVRHTRGLAPREAVVRAQIAVDLFEPACRDAVPLARSLYGDHAYRAALEVLEPLLERAPVGMKSPLLAEAYLLHAECLRAFRPADPSAGRSLARAREVAPRRDGVLNARLLLGQSRLYGGIGHYRNAERYAQQAFDALGDPGGPYRGEVALDLARACRLRGDLNGAERWYEVAMSAAEGEGQLHLLWRAAAGGASCMLARGRLDDAEQALSLTMQESERSGDPYAFADALATWTDALRYQGRFSEALSQLYLRLPEASQLQDPEPYVRLLLATAWVELELSRLGRAQECTDTLAATIHRGELLHVRLEIQVLNGRILLASGQFRSAVYTLEEAYQSARKAELTVLAEQARAVLAEALYALGDRDTGRGMFQSAILGLMGTSEGMLLAEAVRGRARVQATERDPVDIFKPVERLLEGQPVPILRLEQLLSRAAWLRQHDDPIGAQACHREAAMVLNRVATHLNDTDRAALRVHPWSTWIRRGLVGRSGAGRGKGAG